MKERAKKSPPNYNVKALNREIMSSLETNLADWFIFGPTKQASKQNRAFDDCCFTRKLVKHF